MCAAPPHATMFPTMHATQHSAAPYRRHSDWRHMTFPTDNGRTATQFLTINPSMSLFLSVLRCARRPFRNLCSLGCLACRPRTMFAPWNEQASGFTARKEATSPCAIRRPSKQRSCPCTVASFRGGFSRKYFPRGAAQVPDRLSRLIRPGGRPSQRPVPLPGRRRAVPHPHRLGRRLARPLAVPWRSGGLRRLTLGPLPLDFRTPRFHWSPTRRDFAPGFFHIRISRLTIPRYAGGSLVSNIPRWVLCEERQSEA
jgi:hypothetical protein